MPVKVIVQSFIFQVYYGALVFFFHSLNLAVSHRYNVINDLMETRKKIL